MSAKAYPSILWLDWCARKLLRKLSVLPRHISIRRIQWKLTPADSRVSFSTVQRKLSRKLTTSLSDVSCLISHRKLLRRKLIVDQGIGGYPSIHRQLLRKLSKVSDGTGFSSSCLRRSMAMTVGAAPAVMIIHILHAGRFHTDACWRTSNQSSSFDTTCIIFDQNKYCQRQTCPTRAQV
jgi:hypothetical protein